MSDPESGRYNSIRTSFIVRLITIATVAATTDVLISASVNTTIRKGSVTVAE